MRRPPGSEIERALAARLGGPVAGIDEAGRGPWAGPVMAAAALLPDPLPRALEGLDDSKRLAPRRRAALAEAIRGEAATGLGLASAEEIGRFGIVRATDLAMARALAELVAAAGMRPAGCLVDGRRLPDALGLPGEALVRGDGLSAAIAAASILAKVARDRIMEELARDHPGYGWERNRGYGTAEHRAALGRLGVTPEHRRGFRPVDDVLNEETGSTI